MALASVGPLTRFNACPSITPVLRSHSQALSRGGRPNSARNPSGNSTLLSGSCAAWKPIGTPGRLLVEPVTA